jgi:hypothetical protein
VARDLASLSGVMLTADDLSAVADRAGGDEAVEPNT